MGSGPSRTVEWDELEKHPLLIRLLNEKVTSADPLWNQFLSFKSPQYAKPSPESDKVVRNICRNFLANSRSNGNLKALVEQFTVRHQEILTAVEYGDNIFPWHCTNSLYVIRRLVLHLVENFDENTFLTILNDNEETVKNLITCLVNVLSDLASLTEELFSAVYFFTEEALQLLLIFQSVTMYQSSENYQSMISKIFDKCSSDKLPRALIAFMEAKSEDPRIEAINSSNGFVFGLLSMLGSNSPEVPDQRKHSISKLSQALLLSFTMTPLPEDYQEKSLKSSILASVPNGIVEEDRVQLPFGKIYEAMIDSINTEQGVLLLYILIHENESFKNYVLSKTDIDRLVLPILKILSRPEKNSSHHLYMTLVVLLILTEDDSFCGQINEVGLKKADLEFYNEDQATANIVEIINLSSLVQLVLMRVIQFNLSRVKDQYLHTNCLAALSNVGIRLKGIHRRVSQRFLNLITIISKRLDISNDEANHVAILKTLLDIINACLNQSLDQNLELVYHLLHQRASINRLRSIPGLAELVDNIELVIGFFSGHLKLGKDDTTVLNTAEIQTIIGKVVRQLPRSKLKQFPPLKFHYEEDQNPEKFFVPYTWSVIYRSFSQIGWDVAKVQLFEADAFL